MWGFFRPLYDHLARTGEHFWIAERDGESIGYARSVLRDGVRELTEFFVLPGHQSAGLGRELLSRAFPTEGARHRVIVDPWRANGNAECAVRPRHQRPNATANKCRSAVQWAAFRAGC